MQAQSRDQLPGGFASLQPPPPVMRVQEATPTIPQEGFDGVPKVQDHVPAAPGEQTYDAVPIPGAYASPVASPSFQPQGLHFAQGGFSSTMEAPGRVPTPVSPRWRSSGSGR